MLINIIGAGNLGQTIGYLLHKHGYLLGDICNSNIQSSLNAINFIGSGRPVAEISDLRPADLTFITTPDYLIAKISQELANSNNLKPESIILHCSGALTSDILIATKIKNCHIASTHPMTSFANPNININQYTGTYCAIEGDPEILEFVATIFQNIGSITYNIHPDQKALYHASGVFASNYLITLADQAIDCLTKSGVNQKIAAPAIINLMKNTICNLEATLSPANSLTGPIKRGDLSTIQKHLAYFDNDQHHEQQKKLYKLLGLLTLQITTCDTEKKLEMQEILS